MDITALTEQENASKPADQIDGQSRLIAQSEDCSNDDLSTLSWCAAEIRSALEEAETHIMQQLSADMDDLSLLGAARAFLHQAHGALQMVDLPGTTLITSEAEVLLDKISAGELELNADMATAIGRAFAALNEYLADLLGGSGQRPLYLFPYLKNLLMIRGADRIHPADLFFPVSASLALGDPASAALDEAGRKKIGLDFEMGLLHTLREPNDSQAFGSMLGAVEAIKASELGAKNQIFWHVLSAYFKAIMNQSVSLDVYGKRLLARVNLQLRRTLTEDAPASERLLRDTLFSIACGKPDTEELQAIFDAFKLHGVIPVDLEEMRYGRIDRRAIGQGRDAVIEMKKAWESMLAQPGGVAAHIGEFKQGLSHFQDAADSLNEPGLTRITGAWVGVVKTLGLESGPVSDALGVEVAVSLLFVEQLMHGGISELQDVDARCSEMARRIDETMHDMPVSEDAPQWLRDLSAAVQERLTMSAFVAETQAALREAEAALDAYFRDPISTENLPGAAQNFRQVSGVLSLLGQDQAAQAAMHIAGLADALDPAEDSQRVLDEASDLAASVGTLGFFIDALAGKRGALEEFVFDADRGVFERRSNIDATGGAVTQTGTEAACEAVDDPPMSAEACLDHNLAELDAKLSAWHEGGDESCKADVAALLQQVRDGAQLIDATELQAQAKAAVELLNQGADAKALAQILARPAGLIALESDEPSQELPQAEAQVDAELLEIFLAEADEVLEAIAVARTQLQQAPSDQLTQTTIRRGFHTLKGSSRMVGLDAFGEAGWCMEQVMNLWLAEERAASPALQTLISNSELVFGHWVKALHAGSTGGDNGDELIKQADALRTGQDADVVPLTAKETPDIELPTEDAPVNDAPDEPVGTDMAEVPNLDPNSFNLEPAARSEPDAPADETSDPGNSADLAIAAAGLLATETQDETHWGEAVDFAALQVQATEANAVQVEAASAPEAHDSVVHIGDNEIDAGLFEVFVGEVEDIKNQVMGDVSDWQKDPGRSASELATRGVHSLKGSCALVKAEPARAMAATLEQCLISQASNGRPASLEEIAEYGRLLQVLFASLKTFSRGEVPADEPEAVQATQQLLQTWQGPASAGNSTTVPPATAAQSGNASTEAVQTQDEFDEELLPLFIEEAEEYLPQIDENLRAWQAAPTDLELQRLLMRQLHTVKGGARMAGAMVLGQRVHEMETRIEAAINAQEVPAGLIDDMIAEQDVVSDQFAVIRDPQARAAAVQAGPVEHADDTVGAIDQLASNQAGAASGDVRPSAAGSASGSIDGDGGAAEQLSPSARGSQQPIVRVRAEILEKMVNEAGEVSIARSRLDNSMNGLRQSLSELGENVNRLRTQLREIEIQADARIQANDDNVAERTEDFDPLEFDRYTRFQELTRMLAESVSDVATVQQNVARLLDDANQDMTRQGQSVRQLQHHLMGVRMVQFGSVNDRLYRVVRQSAKQLGKRVSMDIVGAEAETDRGVLEKMVAPLEHLLRNAVSHGIEAPADRAAAGKSEKGELRLDIRHDANEIVLTLSDDGAGLNLEKIRARALDRRLISEGQAVCEEELANMIFMPGFTTAGTVDQISGRGVGMDVVRSEVIGLGGRVDVTSTTGAGSSFVIHLPLTTAITQVMMVTVAEQSYAVPAASVEQMLQLKPDELSEAYANRAIEWQGQKVPLYFLASLVDLAENKPMAQNFSPVIVLRSGGRRIAVHADQISKGQEVVVKNVGPQAARVHGVVGATVMGNGHVVLILNLGQLAEGVSDVVRDAGMQAGMAAQLTDTPTVVMVVDDSVTVRKVTERLLTREGFEVVLAKDGVDALRQLEDQKPDIILSDIEMPRMDGFDFARALRKDERHAKLPIVMITSRTADKHKDFAMSLGVNEFLGKPYDESELLGLIATHTADKKSHH